MQSPRAPAALDHAQIDEQVPSPATPSHFQRSSIQSGPHASRSTPSRSNMDVRELDDDRLLIEHEHGHVEVREIAPAVFITRYYGTAPVIVIDPVLERFNRRIAEGHRISLSIDATDLAFFEAEFRRRLTDWMRENKAHLDDVHLLFSSRLVMMGAALVNATIGPKIKSFAEREEFDAAIRSVIASR